MAIAVITGVSGLVGSEAARFLHAQGLEIVGIDNDLRRYFFGEEASTAANSAQLQSELPALRLLSLDVRDQGAIDRLFRHYGREIALVVHAAAQPSHDWAAREPHTDFTVNALGTLGILEATRAHAPDAVLIFTSTNKVYGDSPNHLPLVEKSTRWEVAETHPFFVQGIDESLSVDQSRHSLFGASKLAGDILVQEYGRHFGMRTGVFRAGCVTGPAHAGAELHGFLAYLVKCAVHERPYIVHGYKGKQVRDNLHARDLMHAFWHFFQAPLPGAVYNIGGSRQSHCSILEAIAAVERLCGHPLQYRIEDAARPGDHQWWVTDVRRFQADYPLWRLRYSLSMIFEELVAAEKERERVLPPPQMMNPYEIIDRRPGA